MKRSARITPEEFNLILETVEAVAPVLRTKDRVALTRGAIAVPGANPKMEKLVHRLSDRFIHLSEGTIRPMVKDWFTLEKRGPEQIAVIQKLDQINRRAA